MCLMTRREPCLACSNISKCKWIQDGIDDTMLDEDGSYFPDISEGEYLKVMNQLKEMYSSSSFSSSQSSQQIFKMLLNHLCVLRLR